MQFISQAASVVQTIYVVFFAWMPASMQIFFGATLMVCVVFMVLKIIGTVLQALPFL